MTTGQMLIHFGGLEAGEQVRILRDLFRIGQVFVPVMITRADVERSLGDDEAEDGSAAYPAAAISDRVMLRAIEKAAECDWSDEHMSAMDALREQLDERVLDDVTTVARDLAPLVGFEVKGGLQVRLTEAWPDGVAPSGCEANLTGLRRRRGRRGVGFTLEARVPCRDGGFRPMRRDYDETTGFAGFEPL